MTSSIGPVTADVNNVIIACCNNSGKSGQIVLGYFGSGTPSYVELSKSNFFTGCTSITFSRSLFDHTGTYWVWLKDNTGLTISDPSAISTSFSYPIATPTIQMGYFAVGGVSPRSVNCTAKISDIITLGCLVSNIVAGTQYRVRFVFNNSAGTSLYYDTTFTASAVAQNVYSPVFPSAILPDTYHTGWFYLYNSSGTELTNSNGKGSGLCENLTITGECPSLNSVLTL